MTKKDTRQKTTTKKPPLWAFVLGVLLLAGLWVFAVEPLLDWRDKQRFVAAEEYLEDIYEEHIAPVGNFRPVSSSYCSYTSEKYGEGDLSCVSAKKIIFSDATSLQQALEINENAPTLNSIEPEGEDFFVLEDDLGGLFCIYEFNFNQLNAQLACSGSARAEHYVVR